MSSDANETTRKLADSKKVATFLTLVGSETYLLLKSLLSPKLPSAFTFVEIAAKLKDHLKLRRLTVAEIYKFHQRNQKEGEDVTTFAAELRRLASTFVAIVAMGTMHLRTANLKTLPATIVRKQDTLWQHAESFNFQ